MDFEKIQKRIAELSSQRYTLSSEQFKRKCELEAEANKKCWDEFSDRFNAIDRELTPLQNAHREEMEKRAIEEKELPYPEGTVMVHWERPFTYGVNNHPYKKSGDKGVLQIFKPYDKFPSKPKRWGMPSVGDVVIRLLKKDGTPGIQAKQYGYDGGIWTAENEDPNAEGFVAKKVGIKKVNVEELV